MGYRGAPLVDMRLSVIGYVKPDVNCHRRIKFDRQGAQRGFLELSLKFFAADNAGPTIT